MLGPLKSDRLIRELQRIGGSATVFCSTGSRPRSRAFFT